MLYFNYGNNAIKDIHSVNPPFYNMLVDRHKGLMKF